MKAGDINIRDPYVLLHEGTYYLYGTRSHSCWGLADGFDCYTSSDLENWDGPFEVFRRPKDFFADRFYWAPECHVHQGKFYLISTLGSETRKKGIYALAADDPLGPFSPVSDKPLRRRIGPALTAACTGTSRAEFICCSHIPLKINRKVICVPWS